MESWVPCHILKFNPCDNPIDSLPTYQIGYPKPERALLNVGPGDWEAVIGDWLCDWHPASPKPEVTSLSSDPVCSGRNVIFKGHITCRFQGSPRDGSTCGIPPRAFWVKKMTIGNVHQWKNLGEQTWIMRLPERYGWIWVFMGNSVSICAVFSSKLCDLNGF